MFAGDHDCEHSRNALLQSARAAAGTGQRGSGRVGPARQGILTRGTLRARDPQGAGTAWHGTLTTRDPHAHGTLRARDPHEQTAAAPLGSSSDVWVPCAHDDAS